MKTKLTSITVLHYTLAIIAILFFRPDLLAHEGPKSASKKTGTAISNYKFQVKNSTERCKMIDSAVIVLDKYDLTGAGVIVKTVKVNANKELELSDVPAGKYYASIYTYGLSRENISTIITVKENTKKKKINKTTIRFTEGESYISGQATIPMEDKNLFAFIKF